MKAKAHVLKKLERSRELSAYRFPDYVNDADVYNNYLCITCLLYRPQDNLVYCGLTAFNNDLLYAFDPAEGAFRSCGYQDVAEKYEVKIHRSLELDADGAIVGATSCLHDIDEYFKAPGGALFRFDPDAGTIEKLAVPVPHGYIQAIVLDPKRRIVYGVTRPLVQIFRYDLDSRQAKDLGPVNCEPERLALDEEGGLWGTWWDCFAKKLKLLKYDPEKDRTEHFDFGPPSAPLVSPHYGKPYDNEIDTMIDGGDGCLYGGTESGMFFRLDPKSREIKYLGKPVVELRLPALAVGRNGLIYGVGGDNYRVELFAYDREKDKIHNLGRLYDGGLDEFCFRPHDICVGEGDRLFVAETDTPKRSSYLWECELP